jgi:hypothetical protein
MNKINEHRKKQVGESERRADKTEKKRLIMM